MKKLILVAALSLGLSACTVPATGPVASAPPGASPASCGLAANTLVDERTLFAAESAYNVAAHAYVSADGTGKLSGDLKASTKPMLVESYRLLGLARSAYKLGDVCALNDYADAAKDLANRAKTLLPG